MHKTSVFKPVLAAIFPLLWVAGGVMAAPPVQEPLGDVNAQVAVSNAFSYQGSLTDSDNVPLTGSYDFKFELYDALTGGSLVGSPLTEDDKPVTDGLFSLELDFGNPLDGTALWLQINVRPGTSSGLDPYTPLSPRQPLTATPYALYALNIPTHDHQGESWVSTGTGLTLSGGSIGLTVSTDSIAGIAIAGWAKTTADGGRGGFFRSDSPNGRGVHGRGEAASGYNYGVFGDSNSPDGTGVIGYTNASSGTTTGVSGTGLSPNGRGVYGHAQSITGTTYGVLGESASPDGTGVYGINSSGGWAGGFNGKVRIANNLGVGTLDPFPQTYPGGSPLLHVVANSPKSTAATTRALAVTTNDGADASPFGLDIRLTGATELTDRAALIQTTDFNSSDGGNILLQPQGGNVGIGDQTPANILTIQQTSGTDPIADAWTIYSSRRWKTNIEPIEDALTKVQALRGVTFDWKADGKHDVGLIAEEVGQVIPEIVAYEENGVDARSVDYARLVAVLIEATKHQQQEIDQLKAIVCLDHPEAELCD